MIDEAEKQEIINAAVEKALLLLPEVVGNLITNHVALSRMNSKFYTDNPEFKDKKDVVTAVVEMVEGENTFDNYENILKKAVPRIRERINTLKNLDMKNVTPNPKLDYKSDLGEI